LQYDAVVSEAEGSEVKILHCPSQKKVKATTQIASAVSRLKEKGHRVQFIQLHDVKNDEVTEAIKKCDFVVDQMFSDTPMAGFASEAASLGKPAVVGGHFYQYVKEAYGDAPIPPSFYIHPDELEEAIKKMVVDADFRKDLGDRAYQFVSSNWRPEHIAQKYLLLINGNFPLSWQCDPSSIHYLCGTLPEETVRMLTRGMIERFGAQSLGLDSAPSLRVRFIEFASQLENV
jgi:hypothetical protein